MRGQRVPRKGSAGPHSVPPVCHVISSFHPVRGGAEIATRRLCHALVERGVDTVVLTRRRRGLPMYDQVGPVEIIRAGGPGRGKVAALSFVLHGLWLLGTRLRRFTVLHVQNLDAPLVLGMLARLVWGRTLLATSHGQRRLVAGGRARFLPLRLRLMRRLVHRFTAITPAMAEQLIAAGVVPAKVAVIPNGVDSAALKPADAHLRRSQRARLGVAEDAVVAIFVGRLVALKRVDLLLRAWARVCRQAEVHLLVVGDGPERQQLEALSGRLGLSSVRFEGEHEEVGPYLELADVFVLPSSHEGLSVALLEAMAAGLAPLATDLPGNRAVVQDGANGILVPPGDPVKLAAGLMRLLTNPELRRTLGIAAHETVAAEYGLDAAVDAHLLAYGEARGYRADFAGANLTGVEPAR